MRELLGADALDRLIGARENEMRTAYQAAMVDAEGLETRIAALTEIRSREGYMAEWQRTEDGWLLIENHCPICAAASICQGFCRAELAIFRDALGPDCSIEREEHMLHGARRCAYRIRQEQPST